jgi:adenylate kinase
MKRRIVLLGPPGSGKGTIAVRLQENFGYSHVSSGHWLRQEVESRNETGRQVQGFLERGELVPDEIVLSFMGHRLSAELLKPGFVLDGFPRTLAQAKALDEWLANSGGFLDAALLCDCSDSVILDRITGRRVCAKCGRGYHVRNMPPKVAGKCDSCRSQLVQRDDDTELVVRKRLMVYSHLTTPLIQYYREQRKLRVVDAAQPAERFYEASIEALKNDNFKK